MTKDALAEGRTAQEILSEGLIAGMSVVGEDFKYNILYVPEVLIAARAMKAGMGVLKPTFLAIAVTRSMPARLPTRTDIVFRERIRPTDAGSMPPYFPSELSGDQPRPLVISPRAIRPSLISVSGRIPTSKPAT